MVIEEMTIRECRAMLAGRHLAHLSCALNNQPYVVPIHVDFDDQFLYGYATLGQKIEWMRQNPLVCLEVDQITHTSQWATIVVFGRYEELPDLPEYEGPRQVAVRLFQRHPMWWEPASVPPAGAGQLPRIVFRIEVGHITGRRASPDTVNTTDVLETPSATKQQRSLADVVRRVLGRR